MTYIKIKTPKNENANLQFMLKLLLLAVLVVLVAGINLYLFKMNTPQSAGTFLGWLPQQAQNLLHGVL
ncbi:hypothetical protein C7N43_34095 [Sphingobacteriales bacterium UPWRP_1]|nr:hypothetical protein BVG80_00985 [Sphingobacteriales bacterium TSM_CSM]PSJ72479.1 hypothetical protein C7N43_34095 [Sphingobacteriales bacterium UPWRP_1]